MNKRLIVVLSVAITFALGGLVFIQTLWIRNTIALKDAQFNESVDNALIAVSDRLERAEALSEVREHGDLQVLSHRHGAENVQPPEMEGDTIVIHSEPPAHERPIILHAPADTLIDTVPPMPHDPLVDQIVQGILGARNLKDIAERIDPVLLDSLIDDELGRRHIHVQHDQGVFSDNGRVVFLVVRNRSDSAKVRTSSHRVQLFRNDLSSDVHWLHVHVLGQDRFVLRSLWPMLVASAIFVLLIVLAFVYTLRTIWRQKRLNDIRNDLVNNLTHELKTPISTIALACEALNDPAMGKSPEQLSMFTGMIRDENKRLGMLVENVLQSAVVDSGRMLLRLTTVDLHAVLAEVVRHSAIQASNRGGSIELRPEAELAHVIGDRIHLTNVFYNLIDNAVKYCEREPRIVITTHSDARALTIEVKDNGIGIPKSEQRKIFDRLYRVPTGDRHNVKGFGLGLSYVRSVVERHQGTIRVQSEPGNGSVFSITIPFEHGQRDQASSM